VLSAPKWHTGTVARWEIGWPLTGMARAVLSVACRRASLWLLPEDDFYRKVFTDAHALAGPTWAKSSKALLCKWGIDDFADCPVTTYAAYKKHVQDLLLSSCCSMALTQRERHMLPVQHVRLAPVPPTVLRLALTANPPLPWRCLIDLRAWCRFRAGLLVVSHRNHKRSQAKVQLCVFCGCLTRFPAAHAFFLCDHLASHRPSSVVVSQTLGLQGSLCRFLQTDPGEVPFVDLTRFVGSIEHLATAFWMEHQHT